jgi:DNA-binding winged helix-turn-helix (wHTH) protein
MSPKAFAVLAYLVEHAGRLVTHDGLLEAVWPNVVVEPQAVKKHILAVRSTPRREASFCLATRPDARSNLPVAAEMYRRLL